MSSCSDEEVYRPENNRFQLQIHSTSMLKLTVNHRLGDTSVLAGFFIVALAPMVRQNRTRSSRQAAVGRPEGMT